jgi:hypothetical protein
MTATSTTPPQRSGFRNGLALIGLTAVAAAIPITFKVVNDRNEASGRRDTTERMSESLHCSTLEATSPLGDLDPDVDRCWDRFDAEWNE